MKITLTRTVEFGNQSVTKKIEVEAPDGATIHEGLAQDMWDALNVLPADVVEVRRGVARDTEGA